MNARFLSMLLALTVGCGSLGGCESVRESVRERFTAMPRQVRAFPGEPKLVFAAARRAMERFGFDMVRGGPAQGKIEGLTRVGPGDDIQSSRQREITIQLEPLGNGNVEVSVLIKEIDEDRFSRLSSPTTEAPVRDPAVYDAFFAELGRQLQGVADK